MANTKSAEKRIGSNERKRLRNQMYRSRVKTMIRKAEQLISGGESSEEAIREAISTLDKAAVKGIIHKNNAARRKSRLMKKFNTYQPPAETAGAKPARKAAAKRARAASAKPAAAKPAKATTRRATAKS